MIYLSKISAGKSNFFIISSSAYGPRGIGYAFHSGVLSGTFLLCDLIVNRNIKG
jgi:hypothetical protein